MKFSTNDDQRLKIFLNILVLAISLYIISVEKFIPRKTSHFEQIMIDSFAPIQKGIISTKIRFKSLFENYFYNVNASKENKILHKKVKELDAQIFTMQEVLRENERLKALFQFGKEIRRRRVLARVVAWDSSSDFKVIRINKGLKHGIRLESPVVTADGLVGHIYRMSDNYSDILTLLDSNSRVDAMVLRLRAHGIMEGLGNSMAMMKHIPRTEPVIIGDLIITSGLGHIYPKGIKIGEVYRMEKKSYGITQKIEVRPSVDFSKLEEVVILISTDKESRKKEWKVLNKQNVKPL